jgi:hypothetical protein
MKWPSNFGDPNFFGLPTNPLAMDEGGVWSFISADFENGKQILPPKKEVGKQIRDKHEFFWWCGWVGPDHSPPTRVSGEGGSHPQVLYGWLFLAGEAIHLWQILMLLKTSSALSSFLHNLFDFTQNPTKLPQ